MDKDSSLKVLDIRPVAPKDRFPILMAAYEELEPGSTLDLLMDHDPKCMYYTLEATQGEASFRFQYLENGPEVWQVQVTKLSQRTAGEDGAAWLAQPGC